MATIASAPDITERDALTPLGRYCARVLAASAHRSGQDTESLRRVFSGCEAAGYGMGGDFEWVALSELTALAVS